MQNIEVLIKYIQGVRSIDNDPNDFSDAEFYEK